LPKTEEPLAAKHFPLLKNCGKKTLPARQRKEIQGGCCPSKLPIVKKGEI
jgi:hypothetical protein